MKTKLSSPFSYIKKAFEIFFERKNLIYFLKLALLFLALSIAKSVFSFVLTSGFGSNAIKQPSFIFPLLASTAPLIIVSVWLQATTYVAVVRTVDGDALAVKETLKVAWKKAWKFFLVSFARNLIMTLGFVLLLVPGIVFSVWLSFSLFIVILKGTGVRVSLITSKNLVKGRFWPILGRFLIFFLVYVLIQIVLAYIPYIGPLFLVFLGPFFVIPFYLLYKELV